MEAVIAVCPFTQIDFEDEYIIKNKTFHVVDENFDVEDGDAQRRSTIFKSLGTSIYKNIQRVYYRIASENDIAALCNIMKSASQAVLKFKTQ